MTVNELAELLTLIGYGLLASRTPITNGVPRVVSTPCGAVSTRGITVLVPGLLEM